MLRLVTLAAAMVLCGTSFAATFDLDGGVPRTARAVKKAVSKHGLDGHVWLGKLRSVGGGRDTLVYVPSAIDTAKPLEVVVYMEGIGSFADAAMEHRHAASIARLRRNVVYVAPDAPSSSLGTRDARTPYWQAGCAERACAGGHAAPGDFLVFLDEVRARIAAIVEVEPNELDLTWSLVGFSRGGKGVVNALAQLAAVDFAGVRLAHVVFADGNYGDTALATAWKALAARPEAPKLTILVSAAEVASPRGNGARALAFWRAVAGDAPRPTADREAVAVGGRLRVVALRAGHHAIGDAAVEFM